MIVQYTRDLHIIIVDSEEGIICCCSNNTTMNVFGEHACKAAVDTWFLKAYTINTGSLTQHRLFTLNSHNIDNKHVDHACTPSA